MEGPRTENALSPYPGARNNQKVLEPDLSALGLYLTIRSHKYVGVAVVQFGRGYCHIGTIIIGMCHCEGYGFQAVYSRIEYINHSRSV